MDEQLRVGPPEHNNSVLIYLLFAEPRRVEIVADQGHQHMVSAAQWETICRTMESPLARGAFEAGLTEGINLIGDLCCAELPAADMGENEQPDRRCWVWLPTSVTNPRSFRRACAFGYAD